MKATIPTFFLAIFIFAACKNPSSETTQIMASMYDKMNVAPPTCEKQPKQLTEHGPTRTDDYYWLTDRNTPQVLAY
ncbi:MAG: hypothetical protein AAB316_17780, partial [Bacteroidota bacterium]